MGTRGCGSGGALLLSEQYRDYPTAGTGGLHYPDFHKQFFQTISCGAFLLKDERHYELMRYQAAYLNSEFDEAQGVPNSCPNRCRPPAASMR